jgi:hypothetical protein
MDQTLKLTASRISQQDVGFLRDKMSVIIIELAKREWLGSWLLFDEWLQSLWYSGDVCRDSQKNIASHFANLSPFQTRSREFSMLVLRGLAEDLYHLEGNTILAFTLRLLTMKTPSLLRAMICYQQA